MKQVEYWQWWLADEVERAAGKRHRSRWKMTAEDAAHYLGATRVEGSLEIRSLPESDDERAASRMPTTSDYGPPKA